MVWGVTTLVAISAFSIVPTVMYAQSYYESNNSSISETSVSNSVNVEVSTGGNTAQGGEVVEGESRGTVGVETIINGETVEAFKRQFEGRFDYRDTFNHESETGSSHTEVRVSSEAKQDSGIQTSNRSRPSDEVGEKAHGSAGQEDRAQARVEAPESPEMPQRQFSLFASFFNNLYTYVFSIFK